MKTYSLAFNKEDDGKWYIDLPNWPFAHHNLMMVAGADDLCDWIASKQTINDPNRAVVDVAISEIQLVKDGYVELVRQNSSVFGGATYAVNKVNQLNQLWLCPVTLFVFREYPKYIYVKSPFATYSADSDMNEEQNTHNQLQDNAKL